MTKRAVAFAFFLVGFGVASTTLAQQPSIPPPTAADVPGNPVPFETYLARVGQVHIESMAMRATLPVAMAQVMVARIFPNPTLTFGLGQVDLSGRHQPTASYVGLTVPIELGHKRQRRIEVAEAGRQVIDAELAAYLLNLRAEASIAYVNALGSRLALERQRRTLASLERLVEVNAHRFEHGDIGETVLLQSQVEAESFRARLFSAEGQLRGAESVLALYASSNPETPETMNVSGSLEMDPREFDEGELLTRALAERPDLLARTLSQQRARAQLRLAQANRYIDAQINAGWYVNGNSPEGTNFTQRWNSVGMLTLTIPLPFSNRFRGTILAAEATVRQEDLIKSAMELRVRTEVRRTLLEYRAAAERLQVYGTGLLSRADQVLERVMYEYQHGGTTLIDVLVAQRTANQVHLDYYEALAEHARALIRLETACGFWDVHFGP